VPRQRKIKTKSFTREERYHPDQKAGEFFSAILKLKTPQEVAAFFRDILTLPEIEEISNRLQMAKLLYQGHSYEEVAQMTGASTTTVARVAHWLFSGCGGYKLVLNHLRPKK
jgi:TrpR-related protein YerC/YecD